VGTLRIWNCEMRNGVLIPRCEIISPARRVMHLAGRAVSDFAQRVFQDNMMRCRASALGDPLSREFEEPRVVPFEAAAMRLGADACHLISAWASLAIFPLGNGPLRDVRDCGELGLREAENAFRMCRSDDMPDTIFENEFIRQGILFRNECEGSLPCRQGYYGVGMQVGDILREIMGITGWGQAKLARLSILTKATFRSG
jgi:hypothetical protein